MFLQGKLVNGVCFSMAVLMCPIVWSDELNNEDDDLGWTLGLEAGVEQSIYRGEDDDIMFLPIIEYSGDWYTISLEGAEIEKILKRQNGQEISFNTGITFGLDDEPVEFEVGVGTQLINRENIELYVSGGVVIAIDEESRSEDDTFIFEGMDERIEDTDRFLLDLELISEYGVLALGVENDIGGTHDGSIVDLSYSAPLINNHSAELWVGAGIEYYDSNYVDYYFGVKANEVTAERSLYSGTNASSPYIGYTFSYQLAKQWSISHELRVRQLADEIVDSPLTEDDDITIDGLISITYKLCNKNCNK